MDLIITIGRGVIPLEGLELRKVVKLQGIDKKGNPQDIGFFSLECLLKALNSPKGVPFPVESANLGSPLTF